MRKDENLAMNFFKKIEKGFNSHAGSYVFYILAAAGYGVLSAGTDLYQRYYRKRK